MTATKNVYGKQFIETFYSKERIGLYKIDVTIWVYFLLYYSLIVWYAINRSEIVTYQIILVSLSLVLVFLMILLSRDQYKLEGFFTKNLRIYLLPIVNLGVLLLSGYLARQKGASWDYILYTFETAMWENLTFGVIGANILTFILGFFIKDKKKRFVVYGVIVTLASVFFGIAHIVAQQENWNNIGLLVGAGFIFVGSAYLGVPSLGITAHFFNNLVLAGG